MTYQLAILDKTGQVLSVVTEDLERYQIEQPTRASGPHKLLTIAMREALRLAKDHTTDTTTPIAGRG